MDKKRLVINMAANIVSFGVSIIMSFLLTPYLVKNVGKEAYSFVPLATQFIGYSNIIVVALNSMAARFITISFVKKNYDDVNKYFNSVLFSNIIVAILLFIPSTILVNNLEKIINIPKELIGDVKILFSFVIAGMLISILASIFNVATFCKNRVDLNSYKDLAIAIIRIVLIIILFYNFKPSITYIGFVNMTIILIGLIMSILFTKKLMPDVKIRIKYFDFKYIKELLKSGIWNSFSQLSSVLLSGLDLLISNVLLGTIVSGIYAIVQIIPNFIRSFIGMITSVFLPQLTIQYAKENKEEFLKQVSLANRIIGMLINMPLAFIIVYGKKFFELWMPMEDSGLMYTLIIIILLPLIVAGSMNVLYGINTIANRVKFPTIILFITGITNIVLVLLIVKFTKMGIYGIPISSAILSIFREVIFNPIYTAKYLNISPKIFYKDMFWGMFGLFNMCCIFMLGQKVVANNSWIKLILLSGVCAIIGTIINSLLMFKKEAWKVIIKKLEGKKIVDNLEKEKLETDELKIDLELSDKN